MSAQDRTGLALVADALACPLCGHSLTAGAGSLRCPNRHSFDVARSGYAALVPGGRHATTGDTAEMVDARDAFLAAGHYSPIGDAVADTIRPSHDSGSPFVVDVAGGTGWYLARVLERHPDARGLCLDLSGFAARRAARAHPRAAAATADVWQRFPLLDGSVSHLVNVFGPRNGEEMARVLAPGGQLTVVTPTPRHLAELRSTLGIISVDDRKPDRLAASLPAFAEASATPVEYPIALSADGIRSLVLMGPSAHHVDRSELDARIADLPSPTIVTVSVIVSVFAPVGE